MKFHAKHPSSQDITTGSRPAGMVPIRRHNADPCFSIHHEAHQGHEERTIGLEEQPDFKRLLFSFVLFVSFVVVYFG
ncbi:MAG: hypothetical protein ACE5HC_04820 [Candidatus Binatia bacterium]